MAKYKLQIEGDTASELTANVAELFASLTEGSGVAKPKLVPVEEPKPESEPKEEETPAPASKKKSTKKKSTKKKAVEPEVLDAEEEEGEIDELVGGEVKVPTSTEAEDALRKLHKKTKDVPLCRGILKKFNVQKASEVQASDRAAFIAECSKELKKAS